MIMYRNPAEQLFWENPLLSFGLIFGIIIIVFIGFIIKEYVNDKNKNRRK